MVATTRKPAVKSTPAVSISSVSDFKKASKDYLTLPSGNTIRVRRTSIQTLMAAGMIPNSLMTIVQSAIKKGKMDVDPIEFSSDPEKMKEMLALVDIVVIHCVKEPEVFAAPDDSEDRDEELLYIDEIADDDRSFIFQYATGGTNDVAQFRDEARERLDSIQSSQSVPVPTKRPARNRR